MFSVIKVARTMPKMWVTGLVAWGVANGAFGWGSGASLKISSVKMPAIDKVGNQVVKGKDYPIVISYTTECGSDQCSDQKIRFSVTQTSGFSGCFPAYDTSWLLTTYNLAKWFLGSPADKHRVDYHNGGEDFTMGQWGAFFALPDVSKQTQVATITLRNIDQEPPENAIWGVVGEYKPDEYTTCVNYSKVTINTSERDKVSISGLEEAPLNKDGTFTLNNVCVYSSTAKATLHFKGSNPGKNNKFQLKQSGSNSDPIPYEIKVKSKTQEGTISADGYVEDFWNVDDSDPGGNCGGMPNMSFTIQASLVGNEATGVYKDTITVTVEPK